MASRTTVLRAGFKSWESCLKAAVSGGDPGALIAVVDGWQAYLGFFARIQRCWSHILRESRAEAERGGDREKQFHRELLSLFERVKATRELGKGGRQLALIMEEQLLSILSVAGSCKWPSKLARASGDLFTCVEFLEVPMDNNHAERVSESWWCRKIRGHLSTPVLLDILGFSESCKLQGKNFGKEFRTILS